MGAGSRGLVLREDKDQFANQDADLLEKANEGISGDLWGAIEVF